MKGESTGLALEVEVDHHLAVFDGLLQDVALARSVRTHKYARPWPAPMLSVTRLSCVCVLHVCRRACRALTSRFRITSLLGYLLHFLYDVSQLGDLNKMRPMNLAIVFSPNLFRSNRSAFEVLANSRYRTHDTTHAHARTRTTAHAQRGGITCEGAGGTA